MKFASVFINFTQKHLCLFLQEFVYLKNIELLICKTVWFCQSEVLLLTNVFKYKKNVENKTKKVLENVQ